MQEHRIERSGDRIDTPIPLAADASDGIPFAAESFARPTIPTPEAIAAYREAARCLKGGAPIGVKTLAALAERGTELWGRFRGDDSGGGALVILDLRRDRAREVVTVLTRIAAIAPRLYVETPGTVAEVVGRDFAARLERRGVNLCGPYAGSAIAAALEESRLLCIFAGRALKSEDHVHGTIAGLKERSFAGEREGEPQKPVETGERSAVDRRSAFEARQAERAKKSAEKRAAIQSGGALPVDRPIVEKNDSEKGELIAAAAAQQRAVFDGAKPNDEQRRLLRQKPVAALVATLGGGARNDEAIERLRVELTNDVAALLKEWLAIEAALVVERGEERFVPGSFPVDVVGARERERLATEAANSARDLVGGIENDLRRIGKAVLGTKERGSVHAAFSPRALALFRRLTESPRATETYELADE